MDKLNIEIIRSNRKTMGLEITPDLSVRVRAPLHVSEKRIRKFVDDHMDWIVVHLNRMRKKKEQTEAVTPLSAEELDELANRATMVIPEKVAYYADKLHVTYGRITIRNQKTRWGSCSSKGNLNFNCLLMLCPEHVVDYIVVHELAHRIEMNHSRDFYNVVAVILPDYKESERWLRKNGSLLMARNR